jgi:twitching motility two-component system response regulator PilG
VSKILVVDDDLTVTQLLEALLTMEGHQPATLNDSTKALDLVESFHPDLILLDLMMPELNGYELCGLLRQNPEYTGIPVMVVSALDDPASRERAARAGAKDYITKPFDVDFLLQRIKQFTT